MSDLPRDPVMLLSVVNTKLRDEYDSIEELSAGCGADADEIVTKLRGIGYEYNEETNQFV